MTAEPVEFVDLKAQYRRLKPRIDLAMQTVLESGRFVLGPQVAEFERALADYCGVKHVIGTGNGTDAIGLALMAMELRPGDAVICPSFTFAATAEAVAWLGATPVFADVEDETFTLDPLGLKPAFDAAIDAGLTPRALISVDLFGQTADYDALEAFCRDHGLRLICDAAQAFGASHGNRRTGTIGHVTTASFYPAKPLGCYGDGGAILTDDDDLAGLLRSLHVHGQGADRYDNVRIGMNSRLDTLQAAILLEKLTVFDDEIAARQAVAARYAERLAEVAIVPRVKAGRTSVWAQYTVRVPASVRSGLAEKLRAEGIPTAIYYPLPLHRQTAFRRFPIARGGLATSERLAGEVLSLPIHPYLDKEVQDRIIGEVRAGLASLT